jgi:Domain of unknown function (DUF6471)
MGLAATEEEIRDKASTFIKAELKRAKMTYADLAEKMKGHGLPDESETTIKAKLKRGTFSAAFFLAALAAMELTGIDLSDL